ncbi:hypothetical protein [Lonsdalea populi]|uniref:hypothetical protein n=1 Tax=Lonsdalea populi TaxID=1172565 RepID=UPI003F68AF80
MIERFHINQSQYHLQFVSHLAIKNASKKRSMPTQNRRLAMSRLIIEFGDRLSDHL